MSLPILKLPPSIMSLPSLPMPVKRKLYTSNEDYNSYKWEIGIIQKDSFSIGSGSIANFKVYTFYN